MSVTTVNPLLANLPPELLAALPDTEKEITEGALQVSAAIWAQTNGIKIGKNIFSLDNRPFLVEPYFSKHPKRGAMKATRGGFSLWALFESFHGLIYGSIKDGVLYLFPSAIDMGEYTKGIIEPLIKDNYRAIGKYVGKTGTKGGADTTGLKKIGHGNFYTRGARLNPTDMGGATSSRLSAIGVGMVVYDEMDYFDPAVMADARGRMDAIPENQRREIFLANPSAQDYGIDLLWQKSDMRWLYHPCACGKLSCPTKNFLDDPEKTVGIYDERGPFGEECGYIRCWTCGKPINILDCRYIPDFPSRTEYMFWQWSHLSFVNSNPARILRDYRNPPEGNLAGVYKNDLGLPYSSSEDKLQKHTVLANCGNDGMLDSFHGPCAMGVDNDDGKHVVVGIKTGPERYEILKVARLEDKLNAFGPVYDLIRRFNIKSAVVDLRPNADSARDFATKARSAGCKVFLCEYTDSPLQDANFNDTTGVVKCYRTGIFDTSHRVVTDGAIKLPRQCPAIEEFARQMCNCAKQKDEKRKDMIIYRYVKTGDGADHYRNATNYFLLATSRVQKVNRFTSQSTGPKFVVNERARFI